MLKVGEKVPEFNVVDQDGNVVSNQTISGHRTVLYFYPKDSTTGCTAEACSIRDNYERFLSQGYLVYGVSKDSTASHKKFIASQGLPFPLLSDKSTEMMQAFGAWGERKMYGKSYMGTLRVTFVISPEGIVERVIDDVDTKNHAQQLLD